MTKKNQANIFGYSIFIFAIIIQFYAFLNAIDGYGKALSGDFRDTWPYVVELTKSFWIDPSPWTLHLPLHYYLLSKIYEITNNQDITRLIFLLISLITPVLFYLNLKQKYFI